MPAPTEADLIFAEQANHNFSRTLGALKRSTLSIHNRLDSVNHDAIFANRVAEAYRRPLIANERCGSWYIDPKIKGGSAYFKSTDGHTGVWKFSLRRLNLHLLGIIGPNDGCIIIDSTRRGKRMPDALSKTIPIWCAVVNSFLFPDASRCHVLHTPPQVVSQTEHAQISALLPSFLLALQALNLPLDNIKSQISKPLRPIWVTPESNISTTPTIFEDYHPIICCTVSRRVLGAEVSEGGYIQGAGDDTENWAHGLTPLVFWANRQVLLSTPESNLVESIEKMLASTEAITSMGHGLRSLNPCSQLLVGALCAAPPDQESENLTIALYPQISDQSLWKTSPTRLDVGIGPHKLGSRNLRSALPLIVDFVEESLSKSTSHQIIVLCESGTDLSIGVALALLCLYCNDDGMFLPCKRPGIMGKVFIRGRLSWISTSAPDANPSRATLQSINSFLM